MRTVACLYFPRFPVQVEIQRRPHLDGIPLAISDRAQEVIAVSEEAERAGVRVGMPCRQAIARCRNLTVITGELAAYREAWEPVLQSLDAFSPCIESPAAGLAFLDMSGTPLLLRGGLQAIEAVAKAIPQPWVVQLGIAANKFVAYVAARRAEPGAPRRVEPGKEAAFLAFQPLEWIPATAEMHRRWRLLGLQTMGQLARFPRAAIGSQFGRAGERAWDLCRGKDDEPLFPYRRLQIVSERIQFSQPAVTREAMIVACEQLVSALWRRRERQGKAVRKVRLRAVLESGGTWEHTFILKQATYYAQRLAFCLRSFLQRESLPGAVEELVLEALEFSDFVGYQSSLFGTGNDIGDRLAEAVRELKARYGYSPVGRLVEVEPWSRLPEKRLALVEYEP